MASLDSANGPSATIRPFLPETILPSGTRGCAPLSLPCAVNRSNQALKSPIAFWSSSGERLLYQALPRKRSRYSFCFGVFIVFLMLMFYCFRTVQYYDEGEGTLRTFVFGDLASRDGPHDQEG